MGCYKGKDIAVLVPTKDRPDKIVNLLESLATQSVEIGRVIIVDGGSSVRDVVMAFSNRLPIEHYTCHPPGQIRQRNYGISLLDEDKTPLVAFLDDDIVLEPSAIEMMLAFWNAVEVKTAAISFNITNAPRYAPGKLWALFGVSETKPGRVLKSGYATSVCNVEKNVKTDWVIGGATVWRLAVLRKFPQQEIAAQWAVNEDVMYSYPIGKRYPLYVCAEARCRHEHVFDQFRKARSFDYVRRGYVSILWKLYFVTQHRELSLAGFVWLEAARALRKLSKGVMQRKRSELSEGWGKGLALCNGLLWHFRGKDLLALISESNETIQQTCKQH